MSFIASWQFWAGVSTTLAATGGGTYIASSMATKDRPAASQIFTCTVTKVHDGDGPIWCAEGPKVRLTAIAARELDGTCSEGHPCPAASGQQAQQALRRLVRGQTLRCEAAGTSYKRVTAWC